LTIKAVLFDFDGVIADTLTYHLHAWQQVFDQYKVKIVPQDIFLLEGRIAEDICKLLAEKKGLSLADETIKNITKQKRKIYNRITQAKVYPATRKLLEILNKTEIKKGLVTGSILKNIEPVVGNDFLHNFDVIVTGDQVTHTKPHPEPYLTAAQKLTVKPDECIVIENAPSGITAAKQAGMYCIAVKTTIQDVQYLKEADLIVEDISKIAIEKFVDKEQWNSGTME
jgi:beta-phosphoglucomutase